MYVCLKISVPGSPNEVRYCLMLLSDGGRGGQSLEQTKILFSKRTNEGKRTIVHHPRADFLPVESLKWGGSFHGNIQKVCCSQEKISWVIWDSNFPKRQFWIRFGKSYCFHQKLNCQELSIEVKGSFRQNTFCHIRDRLHQALSRQTFSTWRHSAKAFS